jgi:hypothetical protein
MNLILLCEMIESDIELWWQIGRNFIGKRCVWGLCAFLDRKKALFFELFGPSPVTD